MRIATAARRLIHFSSRAVLFAFAFIAASALAAGPTTATFEGGAPAGFFVFNGGASTVSTTVEVVAEGAPLARPGQVGDNGVLIASFTVGDFGGFGVDFAAAGSTGPQDWSGTDGFGFWFHGAASGLVYQAEIFDNRVEPGERHRRALRLQLHRRRRAGWRYVRIPFSAFQRATDFQPAGRAQRRPDADRDVGLGDRPAPVGTAAPIVDDVGPIDHVIDAFENGLPAGTDAERRATRLLHLPGRVEHRGARHHRRRRRPVLPGGRNAEHRPAGRSRRDVVRRLRPQLPATRRRRPGRRRTGAATRASRCGSTARAAGPTLFVDLLDNRNPGSTQRRRRALDGRRSRTTSRAGGSSASRSRASRARTSATARRTTASR